MLYQVLSDCPICEQVVTMMTVCSCRQVASVPSALLATSVLVALLPTARLAQLASSPTLALSHAQAALMVSTPRSMALPAAPCAQLVSMPQLTRPTAWHAQLAATPLQVRSRDSFTPLLHLYVITPAEAEHIHKLPCYGATF